MLLNSTLWNGQNGKFYVEYILLQFLKSENNTSHGNSYNNKKLRAKIEFCHVNFKNKFKIFFEILWQKLLVIHYSKGAKESLLQYI